MCVYTVLLCSTQHRYNARLPNSLPLLHYSTTSLFHYCPMWRFAHLYPNYNFTKGYSSTQNLASTSNLIITIRDSAVPSQYSITLHYALTIPLATALHLTLTYHNSPRLSYAPTTPYCTILLPNPSS